MILLCRTSKDDKYNGLSYFVVPIRSELGKSVTVRPLIKMTGETGFNEVIFDNLIIDDSYRLDEVGKGWQVAMTTLAHERGAGQLVTPSSGGRGDSDKQAASLSGGLVDLARASSRAGKTAADDAIMRDRIVKLMIREEGLKQSNRRSRVQGLIDHPMRIPLQNKLLSSELMQDVAGLATEIEGAKGSLYMADPNAPAAGHWPLAYMNSFGFTIAAGANEVQRNILGERVLGLPKSK
jgi:alkylation response protein AidB-like acyl-CoA dehydrogenase